VTTVRETQVPGVGVRYELELENGRQVGVLAHRSGRRDLMWYSKDDPDAVEAQIALTPDEGKVVAELLGGIQLAQSLADIQQQVEGLALDWVPLPVTSPFVGRTIGDAGVRTRTGVSIVAVLRGAEAFPAPGPEFQLEADDTLVVVGTPEGIRDTDDLLCRSSL
jgi:TrkA domain protein